MEGFFESFLYLIIAIVVLVLSMKGNKKKQSPPVETADDPYGEPAHEPVVKEKPGEHKYPGKRQEPVRTTRDDDDESSPWISEKDAQASVMDVESVLKEAQTNPIAEQEAQLEDTDDHYDQKKTKRPSIDFDLKKAVIFSAVLDRREY